MIRRCRETEIGAVWSIINEAAQAYRGVIPEDRWKEPYMSMKELEREIGAGVVFWGCQEGGDLAGVMGMQDVQDVTLIRHAYVRTDRQGRGIGGELLEDLMRRAKRPLLVGTWADAAWAVRFYEKHGFRTVGAKEKDRLLKKYWSIPQRQVETSVVLAGPGSRVTTSIS